MEGQMDDTTKEVTEAKRIANRSKMLDEMKQTEKQERQSQVQPLMRGTPRRNTIFD